MMRDRNQWTDLALMQGLHHYFFLKGILGSLMTLKSQELGLMSHQKDEIHYCRVIKYFSQKANF